MPATDRNDPQTRATRLADSRVWLSQQGNAILAEQIELAAVPAPPFQERARSEAISARLKRLGVEYSFDKTGNLLAWYPAALTSESAAPVIVAAHIDTVFGPDTHVEIRSAGRRWVGPGIADNARGLAVSLAVLRALIHARAEPQRPILFAFTVGEEGLGDLRGVKRLFAEASPLRAAEAFIALDGAGLRRIIHVALGSRRFRISVQGSGGHSWTDWGRPNPANAIGEFVHRLAGLPLPDLPRTTLTVARLGGGTSINAIPAESWVELDLRSEADDALRDVESRVLEALEHSVAAEQQRSSGTLSSRVQLIGERPAARLPESHALVRAAEEATRALGSEPEHAVSSTDANLPLALGIPAIAIGGGGESGDTHTENEWFEDTNGASGALRLLSLLSSIAGA